MENQDVSANLCMSTRLVLIKNVQGVWTCPQVFVGKSWIFEMFVCLSSFWPRVPEPLILCEDVVLPEEPVTRQRVSFTEPEPSHFL